MSTFEDAQKFVTFIKQCFVDKRPLTSEGASIPLPAIRATDMATQVSASNPGTDQDVGVPAELATCQTSWSTAVQVSGVSGLVWRMGLGCTMTVVWLQGRCKPM